MDEEQKAPTTSGPEQPVSLDKKPVFELTCLSCRKPSVVHMLSVGDLDLILCLECGRRSSLTHEIKPIIEKWVEFLNWIENL